MRCALGKPRSTHIDRRVKEYKAHLERCTALRTDVGSKPQPFGTLPPINVRSVNQHVFSSGQCFACARLDKLPRAQLVLIAADPCLR